MRVIIVTEQELKSLGEAINRDYLEYCLKAGVKHDLMDHPVGHNPAEGLYKKVHFTLHRWLSEVGSTTKVEHMDTDIAKQRTRDLRWGDMGLITERWLAGKIPGENISGYLQELPSHKKPDRVEDVLLGVQITRDLLRKELEKYLAEPAQY